MTASRRDLLKHFGIGAIIAPVVGGVPLLAEPARLIESPKLVEVPPLIAEPQRMVFNDLERIQDIFYAAREVEVIVAIRDKTSPGALFTYAAPGFLTSFNINTEPEFMDYIDPHRPSLSVLRSVSKCNFTLKGTFTREITSRYTFVGYRARIPTAY